MGRGVAAVQRGPFPLMLLFTLLKLRLSALVASSLLIFHQLCHTVISVVALEHHSKSVIIFKWAACFNRVWLCVW